MISNLEKYKSDLKDLIEAGAYLQNAIQYECHPDEYLKQFTKILKNEKLAKKKLNLCPILRQLIKVGIQNLKL